MHTAHLRPDEQQREIPGWPGFVVTDHGRVFSYKKQRWQHSVVDLDAPPRELAYPLTRGYRMVKLSDGRARQRMARVNRVVLESFEGPPAHAGIQARHLNDIRTDDRLVNLQWGTARDNAQDARMNGGAGRGHQKKRKLTDAQARYVRASTGRMRDLADELGVSRALIELIKNGKAYAHAGGPLARPANGHLGIVNNPEGARARLRLQKKAG